MSGQNRYREKKQEGVTERLFRPGRPISLQQWNRFLESPDWRGAPPIFRPPFFGVGNTFSMVAERSLSTVGGAGARRAYFSAFIGSEDKIFADEIDKHNLFRFLAMEAVRWQVPIADFVVTDEKLCLVLCREGAGEPDPTVRRWYEYALSQFLLCLKRRYSEYYLQNRGFHCAYIVGNSLQIHEGAEQALRECCRIHVMPLQLGYVDELKKYWFSGYTCIRSRFAWNFMDPTGLLRDLGDCPGTAVRRYEAAHRAYLREVLPKKGTASAPDSEEVL